MIRKMKFLIGVLCLTLIITGHTGMISYAAEEEGNTAAESGLQDENEERLEETTAMDANGNIYDLQDTDGTVEESSDNEEIPGNETDSAQNGTAFFAERSVQNAAPLVVNFNTKGNSVTYYNGSEGYTNGAYGADAAYLGTAGNGKIRFMLSGVTGTVSSSDVELVDYSKVADNVSYYTVSGGKLIHKISQNLNKKQSSSINNGPAPSYLSEGMKYYSYDGHYFYSDYQLMLQDYQNNSVGASSVNAGSAFYNYFQFGDMNDSTSYSGEELNNILDTAMKNAGKSSSGSKLTGTGGIFVKYQNEYGVNALLSLGIAINESAWGTSSIARNKNNLFGLNAVDSSPGTHASIYASVDECIRQFMDAWMARGYLKDGNWKNYGEFLGNKAEGINVKYASDPYWGEKAAAIAWMLDDAGGNRDYLGIPSDDSQQVPEPVPEEPSAGEETPEEPSVTEEPSAGEETPEEPSVTEEPSAGEETPEEPSVAEEPSAGEETPEEPSVAEEPSAGEETPEEPSVAEEPSAGEETPEKPSVTEEPSAGKENPEDTTAEEKKSDETAPTDQTSDIVEKEERTESAPELKPAITNPGAVINPVVSVMKTLSDTAAGISVSGNLSSGAAIKVQKINQDSEQYSSFVSASPVNGKVILGVYNVSLTGTLTGKADLTFEVGDEYNGKNVVVVHYLDDGSYEEYTGTVRNGQVTIRTTGFSPYVIALDNANSDQVPKTGVTENPALWSAMMGISAIVLAAIFYKRKIIKK